MSRVGKTGKGVKGVRGKREKGKGSFADRADRVEAVWKFSVSERSNTKARRTSFLRHSQGWTPSLPKVRRPVYWQRRRLPSLASSSFFCLRRQKGHFP